MIDVMKKTQWQPKVWCETNYNVVMSMPWIQMMKVNRQMRNWYDCRTVTYKQLVDT